MAYRLSDRHKQDKISAQNNNSNNAVWSAVANVCILFGVVGLITSGFYAMSDGRAAYSQTIYAQQLANGVMIGPMQIQEEGSIYSIVLDSSLSTTGWSYIGVEVLDSSQQTLFSFGDEFWYEKGYDSDGAWTSRNENSKLTTTFPKPGTYYLRLTSDPQGKTESVKVSIVPRKGSHIPHLAFGILSLIAGFILYVLMKNGGQQAKGIAVIIGVISLFFVFPALIFLVFVVGPLVLFVYIIYAARKGIKRQPHG